MVLHCGPLGKTKAPNPSGLAFYGVPARLFVWLMRITTWRLLH